MIQLDKELEIMKRIQVEIQDTKNSIENMIGRYNQYKEQSVTNWGQGSNV